MQLSNQEIVNLSNAEFETLRIRILTELVEYGSKIEEKVKAMKSEIKNIYREPRLKGRKPGLKSMIWSRRKKETSNQKIMKKQEFRDMRTGLGLSLIHISEPTRPKR